NGKTWPEPCRGFIDFFELIHEMNSKKENAFRIAILSSGHEYFIEKVFRSWGISPLPSMLTDDDLRDSSLKEIIAKPSASLFCLLEQKLKKDKGENGELNKTNTIYIGDDPEKDGKLAKNRGIPFMLFCGNSENPKDDCRYFNDWSEIITLLKNNKHQDNA
ncbi:hypothetical protein KAJ41_03170, partial [Candidatus Parcubacteria bacterium]|nr:hypothetical protein [Candidatus Parcubacteria bacterium]